MPCRSRYFLILISLLLAPLAGCESKSGYAGASWPPLGTLTTSAVQQPALSADHPTEFAAAEVIGEVLWIANGEGVFRSHDGGHDWKQVRQGAFVGLAANEDESRVIALGADGTLYRTADHGERWQRRDLGPELKRLQAESDYSFFATDLLASKSASELIIVGGCDAFRSADGGNTWSLLSGPGGWDNADHCLSGLIVDAAMQPVRAAVDITGTLALGNYVFERVGQSWEKRCSFDDVAYFLESVTYCGDVSRFADDYALRAFAGRISMALIENIDSDVAVFRHGRLQVSNLPRDRHWPNLMVDDADQRLWWISYYGVARSDDLGQSWRTVVGGIPQPEKSQLLPSGQQLALYEGEFYQRTGDGIWRAVGMPEPVYQFSVTPAGILSGSGESLWLMPSLSEPAQRVLDEGGFEQLQQSGSLVWALDDKLAVSTDGGLTWLRADREIEGLNWYCTADCLRIDWEGRVWRAAIEDGELKLSELSPIVMPTGHAMSSEWFGPDDGLWLIASEDYDAEYDRPPLLQISVDRGAHWQPVPLENDVDEHLYLGKGRAFVVTDDERVFSFNASRSTLLNEVLRLPGDAWGLCAVDGGALVVMVEGSHPAHPEVSDFALYTLDDGATWFTQPSLEGTEDCE